MRVERELMRGAGPLAVLKLMGRGEMYGYQLVEALAKQSDGVLAMVIITYMVMISMIAMFTFSVVRARRQYRSGETE